MSTVIRRHAQRGTEAPRQLLYGQSAAVADYDLKLGRSHNFHIMAGTEWENYRFDRVYATKDYMPDGFYSLNFGNSQSLSTPT